MVRILVIGLTLLAVSGVGVFAQQSQEVFGKNRIQYRKFDWQYISGENFDVYYYDNRKAVANQALTFVEGEFDRITDLIGYPPYFKTKIFIYNSLSDLRQSNVGLNHNIYYVGGETEFVKPYIEVAHLGIAQEFKTELLYRVTDLMINEMMFGGNLKDVFQNALLMNLPEWFTLGAAEYVAKGWTPEMDDYIRQHIKRKHIVKLSKFSGKEAALVGQSLWNFIAERYGKSSISNILNYTRVTRNEEKSMMITLGVSYKQLIQNWQKYYSQIDDQVRASYVLPTDTSRMSGWHNKTTEFTTVKLSPDGRYVAYAENDRGRYIVKVKSLETGKETTILSHGSKVISQRVDYRLPIISWSDSHTLGVIAVNQGEYTFWLYDLSTNTRLPRDLDNFNNVRSISFSSNGRLAVLSADYEGQNDLYLISTRRDRVRRLTDDIYDDLDPAFIPGSNRFVFSSNRETDSLKMNQTRPLEEITNNYNLFVFDLDTTENVVARVTNTLSKDYSPIPLNDDVFYYLSDQRGIVNLFRYDRSTKIYSQVTNFMTSIKELDMNVETRTLAYVLNQDLKDDIYIDRNFNINRQVFTPATRRKELQQVRQIRERQKAVEQNKSMSIKDIINARLQDAKTSQDSVKSDSLTQPGVDSLLTSTPSDSTVIDSVQTEPKAPTVVNTENYTFEDEAIKQVQPSETFLTRYMKARDQSRVLGPFPYESKFSANNLVTSAVIDPMRGFGVLIEAQMNDMLENYRFFGGLMTTVDLRNGDVYGEFQYLPQKIDYSLRFERKSIRWEPFTNDTTYHISMNKVEVGASYPISDRARITLKPFAGVARSVNLGPVQNASTPPTDKPFNNYYLGVKSEIVYDNSITTGLNIIEGTRGKITFRHYQGINDANNSFGQLSADIRHYQRIYKEIVFAVRGFGGTFFGCSPKQYLLGGMDNWVLNKTRYGGTTGAGEENPLRVLQGNQDILFVEYVTSLRGFNYATLFGNNALLLNAELRVPLIRALTSAPITSSFFRNMQFIAFYDIGTSWSGKPPFKGGTSASIDRINNNPFIIDVKRFINPWLYSYGAGVRTVVLGYYMKVDLAWPVENFEVKSPRWFVTLGFDF